MRCKMSNFTLLEQAPFDYPPGRFINRVSLVEIWFTFNCNSDEHNSRHPVSTLEKNRIRFLGVLGVPWTDGAGGVVKKFSASFWRHFLLDDGSTLSLQLLYS